MTIEVGSTFRSCFFVFLVDSVTQTPPAAAAAAAEDGSKTAEQGNDGPLPHAPNSALTLQLMDFGLMGMPPFC